jgi:hypothetical protein
VWWRAQASAPAVISIICVHESKQVLVVANELNGLFEVQDIELSSLDRQPYTEIICHCLTCQHAVVVSLHLALSALNSSNIFCGWSGNKAVTSVTKGVVL